jgi:hypothetical protein
MLSRLITDVSASSLLHSRLCIGDIRRVLSPFFQALNGECSTSANADAHIPDYVRLREMVVPVLRTVIS